MIIVQGAAETDNAVGKTSLFYLKPVLIQIRALSSDGKSNWFDLGLFGHTHGGQLPGSMNLLGIGSDVEQARHREGWIEESRSTPMLISRGIGTSVLPIRILCSPQIHLIVIRRSQQPGRT